MRLIILLLFLSNVEGLCIQAVKIQENCSSSEKKIRKKKALDESDVINRFEMERVSPLYDIIKQFPPFEDDWIPPAFTNLPSLFTNIPSPPTILPLDIPPTFKIDVTKDGHHVVSESGRRNGPNSALNWWYAVNSYSNVSEYNYTNNYRYPKPIISHRIELKTQSPRKLDEDHVFNKVLGSSTGHGSSIDEVFLKLETTPRIISTTAPAPVTQKPNITTRYILLQSGRIVQINVTSVSAPLKQTSTNGRNPNLPPVFFGSRIRNKNSSATIGPKVQNRADNSPITNLNRELVNQNQQSDLNKNRAEKLTVSQKFKIRVDNSPNVNLNRELVNQKQLPNLNKNRAEKLIEVTIRQPEALTKEHAPMRETTTASTFKNAIKPDITKSTVPLKAIALTTKIPSTSKPIDVRTIFLAPASAIPTTTERTVVSTKSIATTTNRAFLSARTVPVTTISAIVSTRPIPTTTAREVTPIKTVPTTAKTSIVLSTVAPYATKSSTLSALTGRRETLPPKNIIETLPPKNIIETIFNVLQPGTSNFPFLVVNFDPTKVNSPATRSFNAELREAPASSTFSGANTFPTAPRETTAKSTFYSVPRETPVRNYLYATPFQRKDDKTKYFTSKIEYEKEDSNKPKILQYSFTTPIKKPNVLQTQKIPSKVPTSSIIESANGNQNSVNLKPGNKPASSREQEFDPVYDFSTFGEPLPETSHEFFRIVTLQPTASVSQRSTTTLKENIVQTKPPGYRGIGHVQQVFPRNQRITSASTTASTHSTTHFSVPQSTRKSRQNGFHLRNSVGFQTIPPTALSDRRFYSATTPSPLTSATTEPNSVRMRMAEVLAFKFEPTRRSVLTAHEIGKTPSDYPITQTLSTPTARQRGTTIRPNRANVLFRAQPTKPTAVTTRPTVTRIAESAATPKSRYSTTSYPIPRSQRKSDSNLRVQDLKEKGEPISNASTTSSTPKPFRVYFFEPKRKSKKKHDDNKERESDAPSSTIGTREGRNLPVRQPAANIIPVRQPTANRPPVRKPTSNISPERTVNIHPVHQPPEYITSPRQPVNTSPARQAPVNLSPPRQPAINMPAEKQPTINIIPSARQPRLNVSPARGRSNEIRRTNLSAQSAISTTPELERQPIRDTRANRQNANRRLTATTQAESSSFEPSTTAPKKTKKPWNSPFIRHRPNVGTGTTTLLSTEEILLSEAPSSVHVTQIRNHPTAVSDAISRRPFRDFERIRRLRST